jgi:hypothetical protein|nr:MAG: hypothetical protein [Bacteriophage sp.]
MAKYKVGDKVRIVSKRPQRCWNPYMDKHLGKTMTIIKSGINAEGVYYCMEEDRDDFLGHWCWYEDMIAGLAEPEREPCTVGLRFDGMITTATLKWGGRDVKTAEVRCNPKDTYSRAEGARVAVERLFEKKRKEDKPKESKREQGKPKVGDKFVVVQKRYIPHHGFAIGDIVTLEAIGTVNNIYCLGKLSQYVDAGDLKPYKEKSK